MFLLLTWKAESSLLLLPFLFVRLPPPALEFILSMLSHTDPRRGGRDGVPELQACVSDLEWDPKYGAFFLACICWYVGGIDNVLRRVFKLLAEHEIG